MYDNAPEWDYVQYRKKKASREKSLQKVKSGRDVDCHGSTTKGKDKRIKERKYAG